MKLNAITDERVLFEQFIEDGHDLLSSSSTISRPANRRSSDVEGFSTGACIINSAKFVNLSASCCSFLFFLFLKLAGCYKLRNHFNLTYARIKGSASLELVVDTFFL